MIISYFEEVKIMFQTDCIVKCTKSAHLRKPFVGKVSEVTANHLLVDILHNDPSERYVAFEIDYTTQVAIDDAAPVKIRRYVAE
jgi:hypothetical protein